MISTHVFNALTHIGAQRFENGSFSIDLDEDICYFFYRVLDAYKTMHGRYHPEHIHQGILTEGLIGFEIVQTSPISIGNRVSLDFLDTCQKTTTTYFANLASQWEICATTGDISQFRDEEIIAIRSKFQNDYDFTVVRHIAKNNRLLTHLRVRGISIDDSTYTYVYGPCKYIKQMRNAIVGETVGTGANLRDILIKYIVCHVDADQETRETRAQKLPVPLEKTISTYFDSFFRAGNCPIPQYFSNSR